MNAIQETRSPGSPNILLMEDEDTVAEGLQMVLTEQGYHVEWVPTGKGALDRFHQKPFDLLVADLRLPDIDGMDVIKEVKKQWPETVVVVITGYASIDSAVDAMKLGAADYLSKPFSEDDITSVVTGALQSRPSIAEPEAGKPEREAPTVIPDAADFPDRERPPRILLLEDESSVADGLQMILSEKGYRVDLASTGQAALDIIGRNIFDVLVADLRLPDINGMAVIRRVKETHPETAVVAITGYASVSSAVDAMKSGAVDYLAKPFTEDEVIGAVREALEINEKMRIQGLIDAVDSEEGKLIQKREVLRVLDKAAGDIQFWRTLLEKGSGALSSYALSNEAKAALISGDLEWITEHVGTLTREQLQWIQSRLEMERW